MRRWVLPLAAIGFSHAAGASELDVGYLRGSAGPPTYQVIQTPAQEWNAATYRSVIGQPSGACRYCPASGSDFAVGVRIWVAGLVQHG